MNNPFVIVAISAALSIMPVIIWAAMFLYKHNEKMYVVAKAFSLGALMVIPLIGYRIYWNYFPEISLVEGLKFLDNTSLTINLLGSPNVVILPLSILVLFATVGFLEEYLKNRVTRNVDKKEINSIDDAIEFSIMAALGFAFAENTFYFIEVWQHLGVDMLLQVFIFRSIFSTFAHVLFSAIYGYHYGLALFAKPVYKSLSRNNIDKKFIVWIHKITHRKSSEIFEDQQRFIGLVYAGTLHAGFNIMLELGATTFLVPFLVLGVIHVLMLIWNRQNHVEYSVREQS